MLLLGFSNSVYAQTVLHIEGARRTQPAFLARQLDALSLSASDAATTLQIDTAQIRLDAAGLVQLRQQLVNLPQIRDVSLTQRGDSLVAIVQEASSRMPLFGFGGVKGNVNALVGFSDQHLLGLGQQLSGYYQYNQGRHNYSVTYRNPNLRGSRWGLGLESRRYGAIEPVYFTDQAIDYDYLNQGVGATVSYRLRQREEVLVGVTAFRETFERLGAPDEAGIAPASVAHNKLLFKVGYQRDRRDWISERVDGTYQEVLAEAVLNRTEDPFAIAFYALSHYRLIGRRGNLASRLRLGLSTNRNSPFAPFTLDSQLNIRGSGNRIDRGTAQLVWNLEYRHRVYADRKGNLRAQVVAFSDFGSWRSPGGSLSELADRQVFQHFVGGGIRISSARAQNSVLRVDYGIDWRAPERRGIVVGFGQYF